MCSDFMVISHYTIALRAESLSGPIFSRRSKETLLSGYYTTNIPETFQAFTISSV